MATPEQMAGAALACAALDEALDDIMATARDALAKYGPVQARAAVTVALLMASAIGSSGNVEGIAASAILRLAQLEQIEEATGGEPDVPPQ